MIRLVRNRIDGIAEPLPKGETVLWSGRPEAWRFARRQFRLGWVAAWFVALAALRGFEAWQAGAGWWGVAVRASSQVPLALLALGLLAGLGMVMARSSTYALTQRRLVMNIGVALPITFNIPLRYVDAVSLREHDGDLVDLVVTLGQGGKASVTALWPHVRRFSDVRVQPAFLDVSRASISALLPLLTEQLRVSEQETNAPQSAAPAEPARSTATAGRGDSLPSLDHGAAA